MILPDGTNANHTLVKNGWCWWYRKYAPLNTELEQLEKSAREAKKGLWADPHPMSPWEWRKRREAGEQRVALVGSLEEVYMVSELTEQIDNFQMDLMAVDGPERSKADQAIIKLTSFVRELSRKIDEPDDVY